MKILNKRQLTSMAHLISALILQNTIPLVRNNNYLNI